jgi:formate-dependent nitrite reductase cytochrome c552 subunit
MLVAVVLLSGLLESRTLGEDQQGSPNNSNSGGLPPLIIDKDAPRLLDTPAATAQDKPYLQINTACYVCHDNYKTELMSVQHAKEDIGCADCHGDSLEHRNDEDNITPPEIMYPAAKIDSMCQECHDTHDAPARQVLGRWQERCPEKTDFTTVVCTDCHGYHRLDNRTVRWDKETGDVLVEPAADTANE